MVSFFRVAVLTLETVFTANLLNSWCNKEKTPESLLVVFSSEALNGISPLLFDKDEYTVILAFLITLFYLALLVMITFIQVNTSSYRACKNLQYSSTFRTAIQLFFTGTNNKRKHE